MVKNPIYKLLVLINDYLKNKIGTKDFCYQYEEIYNWEIDENLLEPDLKPELRKLFEIVPRYSPYEEDIQKYDFYYNDKTIRTIVLEISNRIDLDAAIIRSTKVNS